MSLKRKRGRPAGSGMDDEIHLVAMCDLMVKQPGLSRSAAALQIARGVGCHSEASFRKRLTGKFTSAHQKSVDERIRADREARETPSIEVSGGGGYPTNYPSSGGFMPPRSAAETFRLKLAEMDPYNGMRAAIKTFEDAARPSAMARMFEDMDRLRRQQEEFDRYRIRDSLTDQFRRFEDLQRRLYGPFGH